MRFGYLILALVIAVGSSISLYKMTNDIKANLNVVSARTYEGKVYFADNTQYKQFKQLLAERQDIRIIKVAELLSSDDPLVVFEINTSGESFPFGKETHTYYRETGASFVFVGVFSFIAFILTLFYVGKSLNWIAEC